MISDDDVMPRPDALKLAREILYGNAPEVRVIQIADLFQECAKRGYLKAKNEMDTQHKAWWER